MSAKIARAWRWLRSRAAGGPAAPNPFGVGTAVAGLGVGWFFATVLLDWWPRPAGRHLSTFTSDALSLGGLWIGFVGATLAARALHGMAAADRVQADQPQPGQVRPNQVRPSQVRPDQADRGGAAGGRHTSRRARWLAEFRADYGIAIRAVDIPIGVAVGLFGQYVLAPAAEAPLLPFVPHLYSRLSGPALSISHGVTGIDFAVLGVLICLVGPAVEELYFRGLLLRGLLGRFASIRNAWAVIGPIVLCAVYFSLVHLEPLVILGLFAFGLVLGALAWWSGRLGPGYVAHLTFNAVAFAALARSH